MKLVDNLRAKAGNYFLEKEIVQQHRAAKVCNLSDARDIGIIFQASSPFVFDIIKEFAKTLQGNKTEVSALGFANNDRFIDHYLFRKGFDFFTQKDLNWFYKPNGEQVEYFLSKPFDILISLNLENGLPQQFIVTRSKAKFKIGVYNESFQMFDLMLDISKEKENINSLHKEVVKNAGSNSSRMESIVKKKADDEILLNFLINEITHYLSLIKS